jgi:WD40 repeat protein
MRHLIHLLIALHFASFVAADEAKEKPTLVLDAGGHTAGVRKLLFTPDGKELISVSVDKTIRVWNLASGGTVRVLRPPTGPGPCGQLYAAAISPDGRTLAAGGYTLDERGRPIIYLIALPTGRIEKALKGHTNTISSLEFSRSGALLASGSTDKSARIWDVATGRCDRVLDGHSAVVTSVAFSPDARRLATGSADSTGRIWSVADGQTLAVIREYIEGRVVKCVTWRPDGQVVATGGSHRAIHLASPDGTSFGEAFVPKDIRGGDDMINSVVFTEDSRSLLLTWGQAPLSRPGAALVNTTSGEEQVRFALHEASVVDGALSSDGTMAATADVSGVVYLWRTANGAAVHCLAAQGQLVGSTGWSPDGTIIAWGNTERARVMIEDAPLKRSFRLKDLEFAAAPDSTFHRSQWTLETLDLEYESDYSLLSKRGEVKVARLTMPQGAVMRCFTLFAGDRAAVATNSGLHLYNAHSGERLHDLRGHTDVVLYVAPSPDGRFLLSGSRDRTVRIWSPERNEPLLSLFFAGNDWIAWTPEGYYAASPGGEQLMGWHINNGPEAMGSYYPASQFRKTLYRPDVIRRLLDAGSLDRALADAAAGQPSHRTEVATDDPFELYRSVNKALADADAAAGQPSQRTEVAQILPPKVAITSPASAQVQVNGKTLEVEAIAHCVGANPVTELRVLLDGRPLPEGTKSFESPVFGEARGTWTIEVPPGSHRLVVQASSAVSKTLSDPVEILARAENGTPDGSRTLHVLAIGINDYPDTRLKLDCAAPDAQSLRQAFLTHSRRLFPGGVEAKLLLDGQATRDNILGELRRLAGAVKTGDVAVVFYAGHGDSRIEGQFYLVPVDASLRNLGATGVSGEALKKAIGELPCTTMLILDACDSGGFDQQRKKRKTRGLPVQSDALVRELVYDSGLVVMCGAAKEQEAAEENGRGFFTRAIVEALSGPADLDKDGVVELDELDMYVRRRVRALSANEQEPTISKSSIVRSFALSKP